MRTKVLLKNAIERNGSELTPWQSQTLSPKINDENYNYNKLQEIKERQTQSKRFILPRMDRYSERSVSKIEKIQYQLSRQSIIPDQRTFDKIKKAKQTSFNGFITKYKSQQGKQNKRYFIADQNFLVNSNKQYTNKVKFINLTTLNNQNEVDNQSDQVNNNNHYVPKEIEYSRKRSLNNLIKSLGKQKYYKIQQPCRNSPWMHTQRLSIQNRRSLQKEEPDKVQKYLKLVQLNLGVRQRNLLMNQKSLSKLKLLPK